MKLRILTILVAMFAVFAMGMSQAQHKDTKATQKAGKKMVTIYACPKCEMASMKGGKCTHCKVEMTKIEGKKVFMCPKCKVTGKKGETCAHCNVKMVAGVETYACEMCKTSAKKAGKCAKCGMDMKKQNMVMMGKG